MLIFDLRQVGDNLLKIRKQIGLTQAEVAEAAGLSDRTYADIERGNANMRLETLLHICQALHITPNDILISSPISSFDPAIIQERLQLCSEQDRKRLCRILDAYFSHST